MGCKGKKYIWDKETNSLKEVVPEENLFIFDKIEEQTNKQDVFQRYLDYIKKDILKQWGIE